MLQLILFINSQLLNILCQKITNFNIITATYLDHYICEPLQFRGRMRTASYYGTWGTQPVELVKRLGFTDHEGGALIFCERSLTIYLSTWCTNTENLNLCRNIFTGEDINYTVTYKVQNNTLRQRNCNSRVKSLHVPARNKHIFRTD